ALFAYMRTVNTADLWSAVWTGGNSGRLVRLGAGQNGNSGVNEARLSNAVATVTISIASPAQISWAGTVPPVGTAIVFTTTGALPTGITAGNSYFVLTRGSGQFTIRN